MPESVRCLQLVLARIASVHIRWRLTYDPAVHVLLIT